MRTLYRLLKGKEVEELQGFVDECNKRLHVSKGKDTGAKRVKRLLDVVIGNKVGKDKIIRMKGCKHGK